MLSERFKERIVDVDITLNSIFTQRAHTQEVTAVTRNCDTQSRPQGLDDFGVGRWFVS